MVCCLQKFLEINGRVEKFLLDDKYKAIQDTLDGLMKERSKQGMGLLQHQADVITVEMENVLWQRHLLGDDNTQTLLHTLVYLLGLHFALRAREEHRRLRHRPSQLSVKSDTDGR